MALVGALCCDHRAIRAICGQPLTVLQVRASGECTETASKLWHWHVGMLAVAWMRRTDDMTPVAVHGGLGGHAHRLESPAHARSIRFNQLGIFQF